MTDIVERLRKAEVAGVLIPCEDLKEAADEIDRLRSSAVGAGAREALGPETIQTLLDLLNPLHGSLDKQTYDEKVAENFDAPRDREYNVDVTAQQERDLTQAVCILEDRRAALQSEPVQPELSEQQKATQYHYGTPDRYVSEPVQLAGKGEPAERVQWSFFESVLQRGSFGIETSDSELGNAGDEKVIYHGLTKSDAERIVRAFNAAVAKMTPVSPEAPAGQADYQTIRDCLQSIADMPDEEPRQPDDADWRFRCLEAIDVAKRVLSILPSDPVRRTTQGEG